MVSLRSISLSEGRATVLLEVITRAILTVLFLYSDEADPFKRRIHSNELWLYKNPSTSDYVPVTALWLIVFLLPAVVLLLYYAANRDKVELYQACMALSLSILLCGNITNLVKLIVGRPRPDFLSRCFPDGVVKWPTDDPDEILNIGNPDDISVACTGDESIISSGRKSFPSGHSSLSFSSLGFISLWLCGKLRLFSTRRGDGWRLVAVLLPVIGATTVALSRTCDYHHHWQDVLVGSLLGMLVAYTCYRQYYPRLTSLHSHHCYVWIKGRATLQQDLDYELSRESSSSGSSRMPSPRPQSKGYPLLPP